MQHKLACAALLATAAFGVSPAIAQPGCPQLFAANGQAVGCVDSAFGTVLRTVSGNLYEITGVSIQNGFANNFVFDYTSANCSGQKYVESANTSYLIWPAQVYAGELWGPKPGATGSHLAVAVSVSLGSLEYMWGNTDYCQVVSPPIANSILTPVYPLQSVTTLLPPFYATGTN